MTPACPDQITAEHSERAGNETRSVLNSSKVRFLTESRLWQDTNIANRSALTSFAVIDRHGPAFLLSEVPDTKPYARCRARKGASLSTFVRGPVWIPLRWCNSLPASPLPPWSLHRLEVFGAMAIYTHVFGQSPSFHIRLHPLLITVHLIFFYYHSFLL